MRISDWSSDVCSSDLACVDGQSLRTYRHAPNTGSRKSWATGDASSRGVRLALMAQAGEMGYPSVLTAKTWGFYDVSFGGRPFAFQRPYGSYEIGRAHVWTPVTNAHLVCRLLLKKKTLQ